jgi:hypothetical protein
VVRAPPPGTCVLLAWTHMSHLSAVRVDMPLPPVPAVCTQAALLSGSAPFPPPQIHCLRLT